MSDNVFKAIADQNRRKILNLLKKHGSLTAGEIAAHFEFSKASLSEHLKILRLAGLIYSSKKGQYIHYRLNTSIFEDILAWVVNLRSKSEEIMKRITQFSASLILLAVYIISVGYLAMVVPADASIPIHWNARGEIDAYTSKGGAVLFALGLNIALFLLMFLLPLYSPRYKQQASRFEKVLPKMTFMLLVFFSLLNLYMLAHPLIRIELPVNPVLIIIGLMLAVLGNILPKVPRNFFVGIRTPWAISDEENWHKTHRVGGKVFLLVVF
jgi:uncharacterized membrane protein/predicted transcriptional regulator